MGDWTREAAAEDARLLAAHIARTVGRLESLAGRYGELRNLLGGAGRVQDLSVPPSGNAPGPRLPLRVDVLDTMAEIEAYLRELVPLVRGTLRLGTNGRPPADRGRRVRAGLLFLASGLAGVYAEDPSLGDDVSRGAWQLERRAGWIFGDRSRAFALSEPCEVCGVPALWVVPERMMVRCGNPACNMQRPVDAVLPAYTSGPA
jgi:hypothetical protein